MSISLSYPRHYYSPQSASESPKVSHSDIPPDVTFSSCSARNALAPNSLYWTATSRAPPMLRCRRSHTDDGELGDGLFIYRVFVIYRVFFLIIVLFSFVYSFFFSFFYSFLFSSLYSFLFSFFILSCVLSFSGYATKITRRRRTKIEKKETDIETEGRQTGRG